MGAEQGAPVQFPVVLDADAAKASVNELDKRIRGIEGAFEQASEGAKKTGAAIEAAKKEAAELAAKLGKGGGGTPAPAAAVEGIQAQVNQLRGPLRAAAGLAGQMSVAFGGAGNQASRMVMALTGAFGVGGVAGIGVATLTTGIGLLVSSYAKIGEAAEEAAARAKAAADETREKQDELNRKLLEEIRVRKILAGGGYTVEQADRTKTLGQYRADLAKTTAQLAAAERDLEWQRQTVGGNSEARIAAAEKRVNDLRIEMYRLQGLANTLSQAQQGTSDDAFAALVKERAKKAEDEAKKAAEDAAREAKRREREAAAEEARDRNERMKKAIELVKDTVDAGNKIRADAEKERLKDAEEAQKRELEAGEKFQKIQYAAWDELDRRTLETRARMESMFGAGISAEFVLSLESVKDLLEEASGGSTDAATSVGMLAAATKTAGDLMAEGFEAARAALEDYLDLSSYADQAAQKQLANRILANKIDDKIRKDSQKLGRQVSADEISLAEKKRMAREADSEAARQREIDNRNEQLAALGEFMSRTASEAGIHAIMETAKALSTIEMPAISAAHWASAATYAGVAVAAGAAGASVSASRGATGGERTAIEDADRERQRMLERQQWDNEASARDTANRARWGDMGTVGPGVTIVFTGAPLLTQEEIGRAVSQALQSYQNTR